MTQTQSHSPDVRDVADLSKAGTLSVEEMTMRMDRVVQMIELKRTFLKTVLKEGLEKDYATIPGCGDKRSLLKPGAEKLLELFGYYAHVQPVTEKEDWDIGLFVYVYRCEIRQKGSNVVVGTCEADCSSWESKYHFEWKYLNQIPTGIDVDSLPQKKFGRETKYRMTVENLADKRNALRKMAQKRAVVGATVLATATSDLFSSDEPPDEDGQPTAPNGSGAPPAGESPQKKDYGSPISEAQGKRLYAIRKSKKIEDAAFKSWLQAKYGLSSDREIGWKIYNEIVKQVETGRLEMPAAAPDKPAEGEAGGKLSVTQIHDLAMMLNSLGHTEEEFKRWLSEAYPQYKGLKSTNDIASDDYNAIKSAFTDASERRLI